jgi:hypothetical protein
MRDGSGPRDSEFLSEDAIPESLLPVLQRMMREQLPELLETTVALSGWLLEHPGEKIPRGIGEHEFVLEGVRGRRTIGVYKLWMLQRVLDVYRHLEDTERCRADALLQRIGGQLLRAIELPRLRREGMSVALVS